MSNEKDCTTVASAVADYLEGLARRVRDGDVKTLALKWNGGVDLSGVLTRADWRAVAFNMVAGEATVTPLG